MSAERQFWRGDRSAHPRSSPVDDQHHRWVRGTCAVHPWNSP